MNEKTPVMERLWVYLTKDEKEAYKIRLAKLNSPVSSHLRSLIIDFLATPISEDKPSEG